MLHDPESLRALWTRVNGEDAVRVASSRYTAVVLIRRLPGRRAARSPFRDWEAHVGRDVAVLIASIVIPDICVKRVIGPEPSVGLTLRRRVLRELDNECASSTHRSKRVPCGGLTPFADAYRDLPTTVLDRGRVVPCEPKYWPRLNLVSWLLRSSIDLNSVATSWHFEDDLQRLFDWIDAGHDPTRWSFEGALEQAEAWHRQLARKRVMGPALPAAKVLHTWSDGFKLYELRTAEELNVEGAHMGHCVGDWMAGAIEHGHTRILSLRDSKERPKVTVQVGDDTPDGPGRDIIIVQAKGPNNAAPADKHAFRIAAYLLAHEDPRAPWNFIDGDENLTLHAEALLIAAKLMKAPIGTKMDFANPDTTRTRFAQGIVWLEARPGKRPVLNALAVPRSFTSIKHGGVVYNEEFVERVLIREVLTAQRVPWVDIGGEWTGMNVKLPYRTVLPPTTQEVATILLKLRRREVFEPGMSIAADAARTWDRELREGVRSGVHTPRAERLLREAAKLSIYPLPVSWPSGGAGLRARMRRRSR